MYCSTLIEISIKRDMTEIIFFDTGPKVYRPFGVAIFLLVSAEMTLLISFCSILCGSVEELTPMSIAA